MRFSQWFKIEESRVYIKTRSGNTYDVLMGLNNGTLQVDFAPSDGYYFGDENTGRNEALEILNLIGTEVLKVIKNNNVDTILIAAADKARSNLFEKFTKRYLADKGLSHISVKTSSQGK